MKKFGAFIAAAAIGLASTAGAHEATPRPDPINGIASKPTAAPETERARPTQHSGGTDSKGCHTNHSNGDYHCHKPK